MSHRPETDVIHRGEGARPGATPLTTPIYETSTFVFDSVAELEAYYRGENRYLYSRYGNPTVEATEEKLAVLEGADAALVTSSGMAAATLALVGLLSPGDEVLSAAAVYGGTMQLMVQHLQRFGVGVRFVPLDDLPHLDRRIGAATRLVWFESPTNPTLRCVDIRQVADVCRARGVISVFDNTFASPINQQPLSLGVDLVMQSATKYLNGHSDVVAGMLAGPRALIARLQPVRRLLGSVLDPAAAYLLGRGLKTLAVRVARQNDSARRVAEWLSTQARVERVYYPGLVSHPDHAIARAQMRGFGGMVTFEAAGGYEAACRLFDRLRLIRRAASLGGPESLCSLPVLTSHRDVSADRLREAGVTRDMVRLSIGLEDPDDLVADLDQALAQAG